MSLFEITPAELASVINVVISSIVVILAFSLLAYTLTYNTGNSAARSYALFLACIVIAYSGDVALNRVVTADAANIWLRVQWLGIAMLPWAYYLFSLSVLAQTNAFSDWGKPIRTGMFVLSIVSALNGILGTQLVGELNYQPPLSYLDSGPYFWFFALYFVFALTLSLWNIVKARRNCLTERSRKRMSYLLLGFVAPGIGIFPYLIILGGLTNNDIANAITFVLALAGNLLVAIVLVLMSYTVAYFGILTPDRVVRYRLIRFFTRGPAVAILVIVAMQTIPRIESVLGLPRDIVLFSVITGVIICSQLLLSVTKSWVDRIVYREDFDEVAWLRELDRRLLTTSDLRQFLENNLTALCELLQVSGGFIAAIDGPDLVLEAIVGDRLTLDQIKGVNNWSDAMMTAQQQDEPMQPISHGGFWVWPLLEYPGRPADNTNEAASQAFGILAIFDENPIYESAQSISISSNGSQRSDKNAGSLSHSDHLFRSTPQQQNVLSRILEQSGRALMDRALQQEVFVALRRIIPEIDKIQELRGIGGYSGADASASETGLLDPSPIHNPQFNSWVKDALSHYWGGPKLTRSPLTRLRVVNRALKKADGDPTKALRFVLEAAVDRLKPNESQERNSPDWLLYNILAMRFIEGKKVRDIATRLAMSESDLYRKQRVAIGQVARVLTEMEQGD